MTTDQALSIPLSVSTIDEFLDAIEALLQRATDPWLDLLFPAARHEQIRAAWEDIAFPDLRKELRDIDLSDVGLGSGAQLNLKLATVSDALEAFTQSPSIRKLLSLFDWLMCIIGSLASASKRVEQLKEFMEVIRKLIDVGHSS